VKLSNVRTTKYGVDIMHEEVSGIRYTVEHMYDQIWNDMSFVHELAFGIRDTVERTYYQIWNEHRARASVRNL